MYRQKITTMKRHTKLFETFDAGGKEGYNHFAAGMAYALEDWDEDNYDIYESLVDARDYVLERLMEAKEEFTEDTRGLAYIVRVPRGGGSLSIDFETSMGEVLLKGDYEPLLMLDVSEEEYEVGGYYTEDGRVVTLDEAIREFSNVVRNERSMDLFGE